MLRNAILGLMALTSSLSIAQQNSQQLQGELEKALNEAERLRYLMIANDISIRSQELNDKKLATLLAVQAFNYNSRHKGYDHNNNVYGGLAAALKRYDSLPLKLNDFQLASSLRSTGKNDSVRGKNDLIKAGNKGDILIVTNNIVRKKMLFHQAKVEQIKFSPTGRYMVTVDKDKIICVWNLADLTKHPVVIKENVSIEGLAFSSDETQILVGIQKQKSLIHVWPLSMGTMAKKLCSCIERNMSLEDWEQYVVSDGIDKGFGVPYESTCKK